MTPKEKAFSLYFKFIRDVIGDDQKAKQCALIAVDEVIKNGFYSQLFYNYWEEVKQEIEKI